MVCEKEVLECADSSAAKKVVFLRSGESLICEGLSVIRR